MAADKMVYRQNGIGQNGIRTKWYWTKCYEQNGTDKIINPIDSMISSSILLPLWRL